MWYGFVIGTIGIFATVMIMWGGFKWLTSRGNSGTIGEAKEIMWSAIIGLALAFLSYTILNIFNPDLVVIKSLKFENIDGGKWYQTDTDYESNVGINAGDTSYDENAGCCVPTSVDLQCYSSNDGCGPMAPGTHHPGVGCSSLPNCTR